ncbi:PstS family phosphate ABC transporter substrate-binding protein [Natronolimnohabitans sp. A-GB9]|uniref:PstS family phosphate ABC transporter substrate-binding protein n=1 Tax=Natronolimnohabitans sp. A-GB9 TaxID=3069757 RepID=UPI0027B17BAD|nr:PstS family phosphate ABC transporter substrate-binding protein [Natronolimnohabitans sp. A-GB9]MDQ2051068.1 PstS family phosphate ABC transporter substrate-binding protein [Natronolimnohabitans sp. A-GB9]
MTDETSETSGTGKRSRRSFLAGAGATSVVAVAGCMSGGGDGPSGTIDASGSNTVAPITDWAGENFENEYPDVLVDVAPEGTGAGFQEFCRGNSAVQSASREITDDEVGLCEENDVEYGFLEVGLDGLSVVKNSENDWVDEITLDELRQVWEFESDVETWSDVRSEWPDEDIQLHARDDASGTFDYFTEAINGEMGNIRDDYSATSQTNEIMNAVAGNEHGFGWGGLGYLRDIEDDEPIEAVPVESDEDGEFYLPEQENIEEGLYSPLARPLFAYINLASLEEEPDLIGSFARFYVNNQHEFARDEGFYATTDEAQAENHDKIDEWLEQVGADPDEITVQRE